MLRKIKSFLFVNQTGKQTVAKNTFWLGVSNVGGRLIKAIIIIYAARVLGAAGWGVFSYGVTITAFLTVFIDFGMNSILVRELTRAGNSKEKSEVLSTLFLIKILALTLGAILILFAAPRLTNIKGVGEILPIVLFIMIFDSLREFGFAINKVFEKMEREAGLFILTNVAIVLFGFLFLKLHPTVKSFAYAYALGTAIGMISTALVLRKSIGRILFDFNRKFIKPIVSAAWPFAISGVLGVLMINTDIILIGAMRSAEDVGLYSAADRILQILYVLPSIVAGSVLPTFSRLAGKDNEKMRSVFERIIGLILLIAIPISVGGFILSKEITVGLFGNQYLGGVSSLQILILTLMVNFPAVIISGAMFAYNRQKMLIINSALGGGANLILDLILIPRFGILGSAIATLLAQILSNIYLWSAMKRTNYFKVIGRLKKVALATAVMALIIWLMALEKIGIAFILPVGIALYFGILLYAKEPLLEELKLIWHSSSRVAKT